MPKMVSGMYTPHTLTGSAMVTACPCQTADLSSHVVKRTHVCHMNACLQIQFVPRVAFRTVRFTGNAGACVLRRTVRARTHTSGAIKCSQTTNINMYIYSLVRSHITVSARINTHAHAHGAFIMRVLARSRAALALATNERARAVTQIKACL